MPRERCETDPLHVARQNDERRVPALDDRALLDPGGSPGRRELVEDPQEARTETNAQESGSTARNPPELAVWIDYHRLMRRKP